MPKAYYFGVTDSVLTPVSQIRTVPGFPAFSDPVNLLLCTDGKRL